MPLKDALDASEEGVIGNITHSEVYIYALADERQRTSHWRFVDLPIRRHAC